MSSKRHLRRNSCTGKQQHRTAEEGLRHIGQLRRSGQIAGFRMNVYRCQFCKQYHIGHAGRIQKP